MSELNTNTWYSGDWKPIKNLQVPYNGLKISATADYGPPNSPPTPQKLLSVLIEVTDYTYDPNGVSSQFVLTRGGGWTIIPIPLDNSLSPPIPNPKFTVSGVSNSTFGHMQLDSTSSGIYLNIQFLYGVVDSKREELGFIMKFLDSYTQGDDTVVIEVEC